MMHGASNRLTDLNTRLMGHNFLEWSRSQRKKEQFHEDSSESSKTEKGFTDTQLDAAVEYLRGAMFTE